ncbi:MAG TPA: hypothetical protein VFL73_01860 [Solirubrobacteraceae bacterium]|nr:hypothetical protein [Solirubrobacteraceae bacterium]
MLAGFAGEHAAVSLRRPVPLDRPLSVSRDAGGSAALLDGDVVVAEAAVEAFDADVPDPVDLAAARDATTRYRGEREGVFSRCFVCGLARDDGFHVHPGEVAGRPLVASPWTPPAWAADAEGNVRPEFVWAALDCPATFAAPELGVLARFVVRIDAPVVAGHEHVVVGWPLGADGRKQHAGSAVFTSGGELLAASRALLIVPRT